MQILSKMTLSNETRFWSIVSHITQKKKKDSQTPHKSSKTVEHVTGLVNPFLFFFFSTASCGADTRDFC